MGRFFIASAVSVVAVLGHYDIPFGDYVGDRIVIASLIVLPLLSFRDDG